MTNLEIAELLRQMSAAYLILGENRFKIIAYDRAADSIEHLTSELKDYWDDGKLEEVPGVGKGIADSLDELFRTGKVRHFEEVKKKIPQAIYPLLLVPGIGPKKAYKLVLELGLKSEKTVIDDLEKAATAHKIEPLEGFGEKSEQDILQAIATYRKGSIKENRMVLSIADSIAQALMVYLKKHEAVEDVDVLGSLRRQVSTIGDVDISVATKKPEAVLDYFLEYPHQELIERGPTGASVRLHNGRQVDLRVQDPEGYGAMLQYFTGSKNHNIQLRTYALSRGLSLSEHGIKHVKTGKIDKIKTEEAFYKALGLPYIEPELREDKGELELAKAGKLPKIVELSDMKGDLHIHTNYDLQSSHDLGANPVEDYLDMAAELGYEYIGVSDHNPKTSGLSESQIVDIMKRRQEFYQKHYENWILGSSPRMTKKEERGMTKKERESVHIFVSCEVDITPDGTLALPEAAFEYVDMAVVSLHSSFTQDRKTVTKRILTALGSHPKVRVMGHPTGRLLTRREGVDANWPEVFEFCAKHDIAMEINAYPDRLDLPDALVYDAVKKGVKFTIDTDSHAADQMAMMKYGVSVARRGWASARDIVNTKGYNEFKKWLLK